MSTLPIDVKSADAKVAAVKGEGTGAGGYGVWGKCDTGHGVHGESKGSRGVVGTSQTYHGVYGRSVDNVGVAGESDKMNGVLGVCHGASGAGVLGTNDNGGDGVVGNGKRGVVGFSQTWQGVFGKSVDNSGVVGESDKFHAIYGTSHNNVCAGVFGDNTTAGGFGVMGINPKGAGVIGRGIRGVVGESDGFQGVYGHSKTNAGVVGESDEFDGVWGSTNKATAAGVSGHNTAGGLAGYFEGDVVVTGDLRLINADCAEDFDLSGAVKSEPGSVMVLGDDGALSACITAYDRRAVGVVSGAGTFKPGIVLDARQGTTNRQPVALMGKVFCKVDASFGAIAAGDLLTTSATCGHAMKASDAQQAFGAVIGKAMRPLAQGRGLIPILVSLQ
jgi:hypothetical protein